MALPARASKYDRQFLTHWMESVGFERLTSRFEAEDVTYAMLY